MNSVYTSKHQTVRQSVLQIVGQSISPSVFSLSVRQSVIPSVHHPCFVIPPSRGRPLPVAVIGRPPVYFRRSQPGQPAVGTLTTFPARLRRPARRRSSSPRRRSSPPLMESTRRRRAPGAARIHKRARH